MGGETDVADRAVVTGTQAQSKILERGDIFFFYRPRRGVRTPESVAELQRFYVVLHSGSRYRLVIVGRKRLPPRSGRPDRYWAFVDFVTEDAEALKRALLGDTEPARPAGEGAYLVVSHDDHTHLVYALELPDRPREVQQELRIADQGNYIVTVKNPEAPAPRGVGLRPREKARYPERLLALFRGRRFIPVETPELLDYEGAELVFIGVDKDAKQELGIDIDALKERERTPDLFRELRLSTEQIPTRPLFEGEWE